MIYLEKLALHAERNPNRIAVRTSDGRKMSYADLDSFSNRIASYLDEQTCANNLGAHTPVVVYGHKNPLMIACFVGCLKSGHPYVPIDMHSVPSDRARGILNQIGETIVFEVESLGTIGEERDRENPSWGGGFSKRPCC